MADWSNALSDMSVPLIEAVYGGWSPPLSEMPVPLIEAVYGGWSPPLSEMSVPLKPSEVIVAGWKQVSEMTIELLPPIACLTDADCPEGYVCENGVCVKKGAPFPWGWLAIGGGAAAAAILIISSAKKKPKGTSE